MPRVSREKAQQNKLAIELASARLFREKGFNGVSVADLMAAAGLTHGGFYGHFASKDVLAAIACNTAFAQSSLRWEQLLQGRNDPAAARNALMQAYLSGRSRDYVGNGCPAVALAADVAREPDDRPVRAAYLAGVERMAADLAMLSAAPDAAAKRNEALLQLAAMVGALTLARATAGAAISNEILAAVRDGLGAAASDGVSADTLSARLPAKQ